MRRVLVDDGGVLEVPQVEHPDGAVGPHRGEHVPPAPGLAERDVVDLLVVGDQLGLDVARDHVDAAEDLRKQEQTLFKDLRHWQDFKKDIIDTKSSYIEAAEESKRSFK